MRRKLGAIPAGLALTLALGFVGCAASQSEGSLPNPGPSVRGEAGEGGEPITAAGGTADTVSGGGSGGGNLNPSPNGDGGAPDGECAARISRAEVIPLDMYILLDVSASMTELTSTFDSRGVAIPKWNAVKTALRNFLEDEASAQTGVGIQYFPIAKPNVPASCSSDAECGDAAPCQFSFCSSSGQTCVKNADCGTSVFNTCVFAGKCGTVDCAVGDPCTVDGKPATCTKITTSTCQHTAHCDADSYATPARAIAPVATGGAELLASIESRVIDASASTPMGPALTGAIEQARNWGKQHANHRVVAVLVTDGVPTECSPLGIPDLGRIAAAGLAGKPSVNTFAIGVFNGEAFAKGQYVLNTIAEGGGTKQALVIDTSHDVALEFRAALDVVRKMQLACEFEIPEPEAGEELDYALLNVNFKNGKKTSPLGYVKNEAGCDSLAGGWYYDEDPEVEDPSRIVVCPTTCATFQSATSAAVEIAVGCKTLIK